MSRLTTIDPSYATDTTKTLLEEVQRSLGMIPNLYRTMANSPAALKGYLNFRSALTTGSLNRALWEQIALVVAQDNDCQYCVSAHTLRGKKIGLSQQELNANRQATSSDPKTAAALQFAVLLMRQQGHVSDENLVQVRQAGYSDAEIAEIVGHVALNIFSNYFNHVAQPDLDFPAVELTDLN
jgi:uncharacterized peroxidase-related enzyme